MRKTVLLDLVVILSSGVFFMGACIDRLSKCEMNNPKSRSHRKLADPKFRPMNPPVDVMVNPLIKPAREGVLCALE